MGEGYAHNADEVIRLLKSKLVSADQVFCPGIDADGENEFGAELHTNDEGRIVGFIEGPTKEYIERILRECGIECWK